VLSPIEQSLDELLSSEKRNEVGVDAGGCDLVVVVVVEEDCRL
jgi:Ethanolamine utilization protein EutJ (predicted chaperonin)